MQAWLQECVPSFSADRKRLARACREADALDAKGIWAAVFDADLPPSGRHPSCPRVLFGKGPLDRSHPWVAVFNSRKGKGPQPEAPWLQALRALLRESAPQHVGFASSLGTLTYDLVTAHAQRAGAPLLLLLPTAVEDLCTGISANSPFPIHALDFPFIVMSCLTRAVHCSKATRMACRDRLLASLADLHWVLEIRAGGNMEAVLNAQQAHRPRVQWVLKSTGPAAATDGSIHLMGRFPRWSRGFSLESAFGGASPNPKSSSGAFLPVLPAPRHGPLPNEAPPYVGLSCPPHPGTAAVSAGTSMIRRLDEIHWDRYLYHYTRSRPGPWPGQEDRDYLLSLLDNAPLAGHTAVHALIRILKEHRIRGSSRLVRGNDAVVSFTSRSPQEIGKMRQWNPALIRWTFAPYGLALSRKILKDFGARPAVYAQSDIYHRLPHAERFRFQRHEPPRCSWKHEREWRFPHDLSLEGISMEDYFVFVPTYEDLLELEFHLEALPLVAVIPLQGLQP